MKAILIWLFISPLLSISAQLFVTLEPTFFRPGLLYNYPMQNVGVYGHAWYGNIKGEDEQGDKFYTDNLKVGLGLSATSHRKGIVPYLGVNYNYFFNTIENREVIMLERIHKVSFDMGVSIRTGRFSAIMMTDFLNWESMIGVSYKLFVKPCDVYCKKHKP